MIRPLNCSLVKNWLVHKWQKNGLVNYTALQNSDKKNSARLPIHLLSRKKNTNAFHFHFFLFPLITHSLLQVNSIHRNVVKLLEHIRTDLFDTFRRSNTSTESVWLCLFSGSKCYKNENFLHLFHFFNLPENDFHSWDLSISIVFIQKITTLRFTNLAWFSPERGSTTY